MNSVRVSKIPATISIVFLALSIANWPYGYYTLLRFVVCPSAAYLAVQAIEVEKMKWAWTMGIITVLFNPILPVHLDKSTWQLFDLIAAAIFATSIGYIRSQRFRLAWVIPTGIVSSAAVLLCLIATGAFQNHPSSAIQTKNIQLQEQESISGSSKARIIPEREESSKPTELTIIEKESDTAIKSESSFGKTSGKHQERNPTPNFFGIGSTKDEVIAAQGTPSRINGDEWGYEFSSVKFNDAKVVSYSDISKILNIKMKPSAEGNGLGTSGFFGIGSTKDEVLAVQGTPSKVNGNEWGYNFSSIQFQNDRVLSYSDISKNLHVRMDPSSEVSLASRKFFALGSTKDEVLAVQGTPSKINGDDWGYDFSSVRFRSGRVVSYSNISKNLKVKGE